MDNTDLCNIALSHVGISEEIANVDTERSAEAAACRRFFQPSVDEYVRDCNFPLSNKTDALALVETSPTTEWGYSYQYPSDCSSMIKILSGTRNDSRQSIIPYKIVNDGSNKLIHTDMVDAYLEYSVKISDISIFPIDSAMAISFLLAFYIAPRVTAGDPFKLGDRAYKAYAMSKAKAEANAFNEQVDEEPVESEFIRDRE